ncbi:glycerophosphodiester phosphodiesterase family protein, partial [Muribaculum intestinale]
MRLISAIVMLLAAVSVGAATRVDSLREAIYSPAPFKRPIVIAHRGDWRSGTENSLRAIRRCIDMGVDIVELDIAMTRDSVLVLMHDETIDRTTTGSGRVSDYTLEQLKDFNLRSPIGV